MTPQPGARPPGGGARFPGLPGLGGTPLLRLLLWVLIILMVGPWLLRLLGVGATPQISYSEFRDRVAEGRIGEITVQDEEIQRLTDEAFERATDILMRHREGLDRLAGALVEREELTGAEALEHLGIEPKMTRGVHHDSA